MSDPGLMTPGGGFDAWMTANIGKVGGTILGGFGLGALALAYVAQQDGAQVRRIARQMHTYAETEGEVVESRVVLQRSRGGFVSYSPLIRYRFEVAGRTYHSTRLQPQEFSGWPEQQRSQDWVEVYPPGKRLMVYYDPARPTDCLIDRQDTNAAGQARDIQAVGAMFVFLAVAILSYVAWLWLQPAVTP